MLTVDFSLLGQLADLGGTSLVNPEGKQLEQLHIYISRAEKFQNLEKDFSFAERILKEGMPLFFWLTVSNTIE